MSLFLDDDGFYYHFWRSNLVVALGNLSSFLPSFTKLMALYALFVLFVLFLFASDEKLKTFMLI
jgi:predicted PurR-regulated permease PerM